MSAVPGGDDLVAPQVAALLEEDEGVLVQGQAGLLALVQRDGIEAGMGALALTEHRLVMAFDTPAEGIGDAMAIPRANILSVGVTDLPESGGSALQLLVRPAGGGDTQRLDLATTPEVAAGVAMWLERLHEG